MRVLIVEDEVNLAAAIRRGLVDEGYAVDVSHDGQEGLWAASEVSYDAIILDLMLPGLSGYAVLRELRQRQVWTPILMLTAKDGEHDEADALDLGADDYLTKPFSFVVLLARLRVLLRRASTQRPAVLRAGGLLLDPATRKVHRDTTPIPLTPREYALLEYLMRHPDRVISKTELLEHVWDPAFDGPHNVVEVYVGYLRKKIDAPFGTQALRTVRGFGYMLVDAGSQTRN